MRFLAIALFAVLLAGCSEPRIDTTSEAALQTSLEKVRASLPADQRGEFDALVAQAQTDAAGDKPAADGTADAAADRMRAFAAVDNMTGTQAIETLRTQAARRAEQQAAEESRLQAEQAAREKRELATLTAKAEANTASMAKLRSIEISDLQPEIRRAGTRRSYAIVARVRNTLAKPIGRIRFDYAVTSAGKAGALNSGSGEFLVDETLPPGETRNLEARGDAAAFAEAVKALDENRKAVLAVTITDVADASGKSILAPDLTAAEERRWKRLQANARSATAAR